MEEDCKGREMRAGLTNYKIIMYSVRWFKHEQRQME